MEEDDDDEAASMTNEASMPPPSPTPPLPPLPVGGGSLYGVQYGERQKEQQHSLRRHLLKRCMLRILQQEFPPEGEAVVTDLIRNTLDPNRVDEMSDEEIGGAIELISKAQAAMDQTSTDTHVYAALKMACERLERVLARKFPRGAAFITFFVYQLKSIVSRVEKLKTRPVNELILLIPPPPGRRRRRGLEEIGGDQRHFGGAHLRWSVLLDARVGWGGGGGRGGRGSSSKKKKKTRQQRRRRILIHTFRGGRVGLNNNN